MPVFIGVLGWFESILQGAVISWTWRRNIGGREITARGGREGMALSEGVVGARL